MGEYADTDIDNAYLYGAHENESLGDESDNHLCECCGEWFNGDFCFECGTED